VTTITKGLVTITPVLVLGYEVSTDTTTVVHNLVDGTIAVTDGPDRPRTGTLEMLFDDETDALEAHDAHMAGGVFTLTDPDRDISMTYVRSGPMVYMLEPETLDNWVLRVGFQELS
jgi:hypothetical protein